MPIVKEIKDLENGYSRYEILGVQLSPGGQAVYLEGVGRLVITSEFHTHKIIESLLRIAKRNSQSFKIGADIYTVSKNFSFLTDKFSLLNTNKELVPKLNIYFV